MPTKQTDMLTADDTKRSFRKMAPIISLSITPYLWPFRSISVAKTIKTAAKIAVSALVSSFAADASVVDTSLSAFNIACLAGSP